MNKIFQYFRSKHSLIARCDELDSQLYFACEAKEQHRVASESNRQNMEHYRQESENWELEYHSGNATIAELRTCLESEKDALRTCVNSYTADRRDWREQEEILLLCLAEEKRRSSALKGVITKLKRKK